MEEAVEIIRSTNPDVMVQHIQCERRHLFNALFELLNIPYIGSDAHVSANIVDKGNRYKEFIHLLQNLLKDRINTYPYKRRHHTSYTPTSRSSCSYWTGDDKI